MILNCKQPVQSFESKMMETKVIQKKNTYPCCGSPLFGFIVKFLLGEFFQLELAALIPPFLKGFFPKEIICPTIHVESAT
jgi:hypothetical protein